ncbi:hypothetical protein QQF64_028156 [Cirrhinus molitorella]|uniref:Uncharacterized protein n=1 Tax=Cirrhinus molitorella TaxID=172907 RepID=A0ABR3N5T9_9TELE
MCAWIPMCMSERVGEGGRKRERVFHHPVNSSRSELSYPPPTRERERGSHATAKRGEERARRRESEEKKTRISRSVGRGEFWGSEGIRRGRMVNNLTECEEAEGAANSQGEWRNLSRSHLRSVARAHPLMLTREWSVRMEGGREGASRRFCCCCPPQVLSCLTAWLLRVDVLLPVVLNPARQQHYQSVLPGAVQGPDLSLSLQAEADYQEI